MSIMWISKTFITENCQRSYAPNCFCHLNPAFKLASQVRAAIQGAGRDSKSLSRNCWSCTWASLTHELLEHAMHMNKLEEAHLKPNSKWYKMPWKAVTKNLTQRKQYGRSIQMLSYSGTWHRGAEFPVTRWELYTPIRTEPLAVSRKLGLKLSTCWKPLLQYTGGKQSASKVLIETFHSFENTQDDFNCHLNSCLCYLCCICVTLRMMG